MMAKVTLTCNRCGKQFTVVHLVNTKEAKVAWENWMRRTMTTPYCEECRMILGKELDKQ